MDNPPDKLYHVTYTDPEVGELEYFRCTADDEDHAIEQCANAYPGALIWGAQLLIESSDEEIL